MASKGAGVTIGFDAQTGDIEQKLNRVLDDLNKFEAKAKRASKEVSTSFKTMESSAKAFNSGFKAVVGGIGFAAVAKEVLDTNRQMEALRAQLKAIEGTSQGAERTFKFISDFAVKTPFEIQGLTETYIKLQNFGIEPTQKVMQALTDQSAKLGGSQETLSGITLALGQAYSKGKLQAEEMNQLIERGVPVFKILAEVTGQSGAALQEMAKDGQLSANVIEKFIEKMGELSSGANIAAMDTLNGKISNLADSWGRFQDALLNDKSEGIIKTIVAGAGSALDTLTGKLDNSLENRLAQAQEKLRELEKFRANSTFNFVGNPATDQRIQEQGKVVELLKEQKRQQDINQNSAKAIAETWKWVDEANIKTASIADNIDKAGKKAKEITLSSEQLKVSEQIIKRLRSELNLTREQAAGVVGNLFQESSLNPKAFSSGIAKDGKPFESLGLAQWTDHGNSVRKTALEGYARGLGKLPTDLNVQIDNLIKEALTTEKKGFDRLRNTSGVEDAAIVFRSAVERADPAQANDARRIAAAKAAFSGGLTDSEVKAAQSREEELKKANAETLKNQQEYAQQYLGIFKKLEADVNNSKLPELQRQIAEETSGALAQLGLDNDKLTEIQLRQKSAIEEGVKAKYFDLEVTKLQAEQAEAQKSSLEDLLSAYGDLDNVLNSLVSNDQYANQLTVWDDLLKKNVITAEEFNRVMSLVTVEFNKTQAVVGSSTDQMSEFAKQAARNMQDSFANFLFDPFKDGVGGMADNFATALRQMAAQAAAQQIFDKLLPKDAAGNIDYSKGIGTIFNGASSAGGDALSGIGNFFGELFKGIASYDVGTPNVPRNGLAFIHKDEAIIPAKYNRQGQSPYGHNAGDGGGMMINLTQHINVGNNADRQMVKQAAGQGAREALAFINSSQRYR